MSVPNRRFGTVRGELSQPPRQGEVCHRGYIWGRADDVAGSHSRRSPKRVASDDLSLHLARALVDASNRASLEDSVLGQNLQMDSGEKERLLSQPDY